MAHFSNTTCGSKRETPKMTLTLAFFRSHQRASSGLEDYIQISELSTRSTLLHEPDVHGGGGGGGGVRKSAVMI